MRRRGDYGPVQRYFVDIALGDHVLHQLLRAIGIEASAEVVQVLRGQHSCCPNRLLSIHQ